MSKERITEREQSEMYEEMLRDVYGEIDICGLKYDAADALKSVDPVAYRCGFADYISSLLDDGWKEDDNGDLIRDEEQE